MINLVRRASKDLKMRKDLERKRSQTSRAASSGRFSVVNHKVEAGRTGRKDYQYERDTVNKIVKVSEVDDILLESNEKSR